MKFDRLKPYDDLPMLPPSINVENNPKILLKLVLASRALATVNGNLNRLPNPLMLVNTIALQEAKTSTEIENIFTTEDELYKAISDVKNRENINPATKEVLKYREALWAGYNTLKENRRIDETLIKCIFNQIKETTTGYRPPQAKIVIKRGQSEFRTGEIVYTPPRKEGKIESLMANLVDFLNNNENFGKYVRIRQRIIDPGILYTKWHEDETLPNLDTCLERCNIDSTVSHNAVEDALDVISVLRPSYA